MAYPNISAPLHDFREGKEKDLEAGKHDDGHDHDKHEESAANVTWKDRLKHFTFAWFAWTMSTGGVAFVLSVVPNRVESLIALGTAMFVINIIIYLTLTTIMITRFIVHPGTLWHALSNPHEGFFFATFWLSLATMITNTTAYGIPNSGPWLITALRIAFWIYTTCATLLAIFHYYVIFNAKALVITNVLPGWVLPIFPAMLVGTLASAIAKTQPAEHALPMLVAGLSYQGLGMIMSIAMYGIYFGRLMTSGLPADMSRPAMFIAVGPPSFTALALIGMAQDVVTAQIFPNYTRLDGITNQALIGDFLQLLALVISIFLWVLAFWFFMLAVIAAIEAVGRNDFHLNWYAYVFPNVGFTIATIKIGERLGSNAIQLVGTGMAAVLFFLWLLIMFCHAKAFKNRMICWPGKDEDAH
ncbi:voltage-dependent anion channel [Halenospora varia]|nr:voltage-dependent anion channel [Halenospora varia]